MITYTATNELGHKTWVKVTGDVPGDKISLLLQMGLKNIQDHIDNGNPYEDNQLDLGDVEAKK
jgi:hypothetical protein